MSAVFLGSLGPLRVGGRKQQSSRAALELGHVLDKEGAEKPPAFLASSEDEPVEARELVKGDSKVKAAARAEYV